jgi:ABC-2 type transport system permease protein
VSGPAAELLRRAVASLRRATSWWGFGILCLALVNVAFWPSLEGSEALAGLDEMGEALEAFGAQDMSTPAGYLDGQLFALMLPLLLSGLAIAAITASTAGDEDAGRLECLLALPVGRRLVWMSRWCGGTLAVMAVATVTAGVLVVSLPVFSLDDVGAGRVVGATVGCSMLALFHGAVGFAAAGLGARRGLAAGLSIAVLVAGYVMALLLPLADGFDWARTWSPWHWALDEQPVTNGIDLVGLAVLVAATAGLVLVGVLAVDRRDVRSA